MELIAGSKRSVAAGLVACLIFFSSQPVIAGSTNGNGHKKNSPPKVALVLGGGGTRGGAHIGVLKVLKESGIPIDCVVGTSMGALVGGLYCAGVPLEETEKLCIDGKLKKAYAPSYLPFPIKVALTTISKVCSPLSRNAYAGVFSGEKLEACLDKLIPPENAMIENLPIPFSAVVTNLLDGKAYRISKGQLSKIIRASCSIPPLLKPVEFNRGLYVDGGVRSNVPTYSAKQLGADLIIAVCVDEELKPVERRRFRSHRVTANRLASIVLDSLDERALQQANLVIRPNVDGISIFSRKSEDARRAVLAGEDAARKALPEIREIIAGPSRNSKMAETSKPRG